MHIAVIHCGWLHPQRESMACTARIRIHIRIQLLQLWVPVLEGLEVVHDFGVGLVLVCYRVVEVFIVVEVCSCRLLVKMRVRVKVLVCWYGVDALVVLLLLELV